MLRPGAQENLMASLFLTMLPFVLTYTVATWHSPSTHAKRQATTTICRTKTTGKSVPPLFD
jgi:hypothetical protein